MKWYQLVSLLFRMLPFHQILRVHNPQFTISYHQRTQPSSPNEVLAASASVVKVILQDHWPLVGELWDSCVDNTTANVLGSAPLQYGLGKIQKVSSHDELFELPGELYRNGTKFMAGIAVVNDKKDTPVNAVYFSYASPTLDWSAYMDNATFADLESSYRKYISTIAGYSTGSDNTTVKNAVINTEMAFTNFMLEDPATTNTPNPDAVYNPISIGDAVDACHRSFGNFVAGLGLYTDAAHLTDDSQGVFPSLNYSKSGLTAPILRISRRTSHFLS